MKIGLVSCDKYKNKIIEDIMLKDAFISMEFDTSIISWESDSIEEYDILIIRSIWGYQYKYNEFINWLKKVEDRNKKLINNCKIIKECIDKEIQYKKLLNNNLPFLPYEIIDINNKNLKEEIYESIKSFKDIGYDELVIKPTISESGAYTYIYTEDNKRNNYIGLDNIIVEMNKMIYNMPYEKLIIQPFFKEIYNGECSCIVLNGNIIRKMIRYPGVFTPKKQVIKSDIIYDDEKELIQSICKCNDYNKAIYMRVDYIRVKNELKLMELELADPDLLTRNLEDDEEKSKFINEFACAILKGIKII